MKKYMYILLLMFVVILGGCVTEEPNRDNNPDPNPDNNMEDMYDPAPNDIVTLIEEDIMGNFDYYVISGEVSDTMIKAHYEGMNEDVTEVVVLRIEYQGRWDLIDYIIIIDPEMDKIVSVKIVYHGENWGSFIELDSFLSQFVDKDITFYLTNDVELGVDGNSSATTTINGFNSTLEEAIEYYQNNIE